MENYWKASEALWGSHIQLSSTPMLAHKSTWPVAKLAFDLWAEQQEQFKHLHFNLQLHKFGNKMGKLLGHLSKGHYTPSHILVLKDN